jgi:nucleoid-associated protein YgaU
MRTVLLLLGIAVAFGAAAAWQSNKVAALEAERARAQAIRDGELAQTESGEVHAGWAVVTIGRPSGRVPAPLDPATDEEPPAFAAEPELEGLTPIETPLPEYLDDYELIVEAGQSLSSIAREHYGQANESMLAVLAAYNALSSPDALSVGQRLHLPPLDVLVGQ